MGSGLRNFLTGAPATVTATATPVGFTDLKSLSLNGTSQYANGGNVASLDFERTDPFWLGCWVYPHAINIADAGKQEIMGKVMDSGDATKPHVGYHVRFVSDNFGYTRRIAFYLVNRFDGGAHQYMGIVTPDFTVHLNRWYRIDVSNTNGTAAGAKMWINGVLQATDTESDTLIASIKTTSIFSLGSRNGKENYFNGRLDKPHVANYAPTQGDIDAVYNSGVPIDLVGLTLSGGAPLSYWRAGDGDTAPTITDRIGSVNLTMVNSPSFVANTPSTAIAVNNSWTPALADGTTQLWMDATDNSKITQSGGLVSRWTDKSANAYTYSQSTGAAKPTFGTINSLQSLESNGTQQLVMDASNRITKDKVPFIFGGALRADSAAVPTLFPGIWLDGGNGAECLKIGLSSHPSYSDAWFGQASGIFSQYRWAVSATYPQALSGVIEYDGEHDTTGGISGYFDGSARTTTTAGAFATETGDGRIFNIGAANTLKGGVLDIVVIENPSLSDVLNLKAYCVRRAGA